MIGEGGIWRRGIHHEGGIYGGAYIVGGHI